MQQDTLIGKQIGDFIVQERLSRGSRSIVYRAFQQSASRDVALKLIRIDQRLGRDKAFRERFTAAAEQVKALSHKHLNILPIYDYGVETEVAYIAMRLTSGRTLDTYIREHPIPELATTARLITQLGRGLGYAHRHGVIHHNLKPESILMDEAGNLFLTDFGLARRVLDEDALSTKEDLQRGLSLFLSPEQLRGEPLTPRANVFSLGVILYRMTTGRLPISTYGDNLTAIIQRHLTEPPPPPRSLNSDIQPALEDVILRAMEKDPAARFPDVETMTSTMNDTISALFERIEDIKPTIKAPTPSDDEAQADAQRRASPLVAASLVITGIVVLVAFVVMVVYAPVPVSVILEGQSAAAEQIDPAPREIANARRQLGETGFIAYTACNPLAPTDVARIEHFQARADQYGLPLRVYDSQGNPMDEIRALQQAHTDGASAIIHCTIGTTTVGNAVASVTADDVPLIMDSAAPGGGDLEDAVFVADNDYALGEASGRAAGTYIQNEHNGNATVLLLDATPTDELSARARGLRTGVLAAAPGTTLLGVYAGGANAETARETMGDLIGDEVAFDVILTVTDNGAYGAINALEFAGYMPNEVAIFSVGGEQLAQQYIAAGEFIRATARTDADAVSSAMFNAAVELLGGGAVTEYILPSVEVLTAEDVGNG